MSRMAELWQEQQEQQMLEQEALQFFLWSCLDGLRGHVSEATYAQVEKELGFGVTQH